MALSRQLQIANVVTFLSLFPDNATKWSQATDEVRDFARWSKEYINEFDLDLLQEEVEAGKGRQPLDFTKLDTPSKWNTQSKKYVYESMQLMSDNTLTRFHNMLHESFNIAE